MVRSCRPGSISPAGRDGACVARPVADAEVKHVQPNRLVIDARLDLLGSDRRMVSGLSVCNRWRRVRSRVKKRSNVDLCRLGCGPGAKVAMRAYRYSACAEVRRVAAGLHHAGRNACLHILGVRLYNRTGCQEFVAQQQSLMPPLKAWPQRSTITGHRSGHSLGVMGP
jgi:hypothetical protein